MKYPLLLAGVLIGVLLSPVTVRAGECFSEPYHEATGSATVKSAVFMRTGPCQENTTVVATAPSGATVMILAEDHQWYLIRLSSGATGWVWNTFLNLGSISLTDSNRASVEAKFPPTGGSTTTTTTPTTVTAGTAPTRLRGRILLQVEQHGEAWYVNPLDGARYYMKDGPIAYEMMRTFGLGVSETDYAKIAAGNATLLSSLKGRIILRVQLHGEAYYLHPDGGVFYLKDGPAAYALMREKSLGITDKDLATITSRTLIIKPPTTTTPAPSPSPTVDPATLVPAGIDVSALNTYWAGKVNALRAERGLRQLVVDSRFVNTATVWAAYMSSIGTITHDRPDGKTMHQWIDEQGLDFTVRNSAGGWVTNYFSENIAWTFAPGTQAGAEDALDEALAMFIGEGETGAHYRTVYHADWNAVGTGIAFIPDGTDRYKVYMVFHYGSLEQ